MWEGEDVVPLDEPEFDRWRAAAETAFRSVQAQRGAGFFEWSCFMFEQAVQFALKALLHSAGRGQKTQNLTKLWKELSNAGVDLAPELEDVLKCSLATTCCLCPRPPAGG